MAFLELFFGLEKFRNDLFCIVTIDILTLFISRIYLECFICFQTCFHELQKNGSDKLSILYHLTKLMHLAVEILQAQASLHFTALAILNKVIDICIFQKAHHPWLLQPQYLHNYHQVVDSTETHLRHQHTPNDNSHGNWTDVRQLDTLQVTGEPSGSHTLLKQDSTVSNSSVQLQVDRIMNHSQIGSPRLSVRKSVKSLLHQDSVRSMKSVNSHMSQDVSVTSIRESSFTEHVHSSSGGGTSGSASTSHSNNTNKHNSNAPNKNTGTLPQDNQKNTPLDYLSTIDPEKILDILQKAISMHKQTMGTRHKCKPSLRMKTCTHHCVEVMSARLFTVMCHGNVVQYKTVNEGHIRKLVDALDPNHDPVSENFIFILHSVLLL